MPATFCSGDHCHVAGPPRLSARRLTFHLIPHTHWDREWYLPRAGFQARLAGAAGALADLMQHDPAARFTLDGQTILLDDAFAVRPDLREPLTAAVSEGRLAIGPWYVLVDEQIPAGESLVRNLLLGTHDARCAGRRMDALYSPDAFGHPGALPMLAREFGLSCGATWRGLGGSGDAGDLYRWQAPSGDEVLLYHLPPQGYEVGADLLDASQHLAATWRAIRDPLVARAATAHIAVFVGADHRAPPTELSGLRSNLQEIEKDHTVVISTLAEFLAAVNTRLSIPEVQGELRWSYGYTWTLQGVHATRSRMKRLHSRAELDLSRRAEPLAALGLLLRRQDHRGVLRSAWRTLVESQFHDTIGGCASDLVADEQSVRLASVEAMAAEVTRDAMASLTGHDADLARRQPHHAVPTLLLWNPVPRARGGIVIADVTFFCGDIMVGPPSGRRPRSGPGYQPFVLTTVAGERVAGQLLGVERGTERTDAQRHYPDQDMVDRACIAFESPVLPGLGLGVLHQEPGDDVAGPQDLEVGDDCLGNRFVTVRVARDGRLHVTDRRTGEEYGDLFQLEDQVDRGDSYSVFVPPDAPVSSMVTPLSSTVIASGPLVGIIEVRWTLAVSDGSVDCRMRVELRADSPLIRLRLDLDNRADGHRLRARLAVGAGEEAVAGAAFGFERRPAEAFNPADYPAEVPVLTAPAHRYVAAGRGTRGLTLLAPGFFEYEWTPRRDLIVTLLRSVGELSRGDLSTRPGHAGWPLPIPAAQERGTHRIELALLLGGDDLHDHPDRLEHAWEDAFLPIEGTFIRDFTGHDDSAAAASIALGGDGLVCSAIKPPEAGAGLVLRCFNTKDQPVSGCWIIGVPIEQARALRADESIIGPLAITNQHEVAFVAPPRRMVTTLITVAT